MSRFNKKEYFEQDLEKVRAANKYIDERMNAHIDMMTNVFSKYSNHYIRLDKGLPPEYRWIKHRKNITNIRIEKAANNPTLERVSFDVHGRNYFIPSKLFFGDAGQVYKYYRNEIKAWNRYVLKVSQAENAKLALIEKQQQEMRELERKESLELLAMRKNTQAYHDNLIYNSHRERDNYQTELLKENTTIMNEAK